MTTMKDDESTKPTPPPVNVENIPEELRAQDCWVCWRYEWVKDKWKKPPLDCRTGRKASVTDGKVLAPFEKALDYYRGHEGVDGLGFVFTDSNPYSGIDLDDCRDLLKGLFTPWAEEIIRSIDSYGEVSPSCEGAKLFVRGKLPLGSHTKKGGIEMYSRAHYFTVTGGHLPQTPKTIEDRQEALLQLYERVFGTQPSREASSPAPVPTTVVEANPADAGILALAMRAANGDKFARLWAGDIEGFASQSEADLALCRLLAFWFGADPLRVERLFGQSALGQRAKWRDREDYREKTIQAALDGQAEVFQRSPRRDEPLQPREAADDPHRLARLFVENHHRHKEGLTLRYWRNEWHAWGGTAYRVVPAEEVRASLCKSIKAEFDRVNVEELEDYDQRKRGEGLRRGEERPTVRKVTQGLVSNVLQALAGPTVVPASVEQPAWLEGEAPFDERQLYCPADDN